MSQVPSRQPHAVMDLPSRDAKGLKIERLLQLSPGDRPLRMLDIGTGNGGIARYFGLHPSLPCEVTSVDVSDQRNATDGYHFLQLHGTHLPFADGSFDVVISNHVIEHVGALSEQCHHLDEVRRVLAPAGRGYLAVPNRWMVVEPHYRLPFLSWLPVVLRTHYLRLANRGRYYDCEPLSVPVLESLLDDAGFSYRHLHLESIRETIAIEGARRWVRGIGALPDGLLMLLRRVTPTLIYRLQHKRRGG